MSKVEYETIEDYVGKELKMEVMEDTELVIKVLNPNQVMYQYISTSDGTKDMPVITKLTRAWDDIEGVVDYSFENTVGGRYFLHQFE